MYKEKAIRGFCHLCSGQEAVYSGMKAGIREQVCLILHNNENMNQLLIRIPSSHRTAPTASPTSWESLSLVFLLSSQVSIRFLEMVPISSKLFFSYSCLSLQGGKAESCAAREAQCTCMPRTSMEAMESLGLRCNLLMKNIVLLVPLGSRFPSEPALPLLTSIREMEESISVSTVTELPIRARHVNSVNTIF